MIRQMLRSKFNIPSVSELLDRYAAILRQAWSERRLNDVSGRPAHELAFLPANLELTESPPHPAALWSARLLLGVVSVVLLLALLGELDTVAVAPGQLIPNANVKMIQPAVTGVVRRILVQNGERVVAGQLLMDLDPTLAAADADKARTIKIDAELTIARAQALLIAQDKNVEPKVALIAGAPTARQADVQRLADGTFGEYRDKISALKAELQKREAELETTREEIAKLETTAPISRRQADDYKDLVEGRYVATHDYLEKERVAIEEAHELAAQRSRARELEAAIIEQRRDIDSAIASFQREQWESLNSAEQSAAQTREDATKADARERLTQLRAPVAGVVQQLSVHTIGGVVNGGQYVMEIVPDDTLEVEARVSNKDIGFVNPGQSAIVKVATFPYTRFGYLTGTVLKVSNDAIADRKLGPVFLARIRIPSNRFKVENKWLNLSPGMEVTAEIKTGKQKVWQYFLRPLIETGRESLRER
jgi:hemolysin D